MIIDAKDLILGRLASFAAKHALLGETIEIVNCEEVYVTGTKKRVLADYNRKKAMGAPLQGPYFPKMPDRIVRRSIRGMLPYKQEKGEKAFKKVMCYIGVPKELEGKATHTIKEANISKVPNLRYVKIGEISKLMGARL